MPDDRWGEIVATAVVLTADESLDLESLQAWCRDRVSEYKIPRRLLVVERLPRNTMGKIEKPALSRVFTAKQQEPT